MRTKGCWLWTYFVTTRHQGAPPAPRPRTIGLIVSAWPTLISALCRGALAGLLAGSCTCTQASWPSLSGHQVHLPTWLGPTGEPQLGGHGALQGRSGWQFMACGTSSLPTHDLSRRYFPWKAAPSRNPLPGRQAALPQVLTEFIGQARGRSGRQRPPGKGPFPSEMTNGFPQLRTSARAHSCVQRPCGIQAMMEPLCSAGAGPTWLPSDPAQTLSVSGVAEGLREARRQGASHGGRNAEMQRQMERGRRACTERHQSQHQSQAEKLTCRQRQRWKRDRGNTQEQKHSQPP